MELVDLAGTSAKSGGSSLKEDESGDYNNLEFADIPTLPRKTELMRVFLLVKEDSDTATGRITNGDEIESLTGNSDGSTPNTTTKYRRVYPSLPI